MPSISPLRNRAKFEILHAPALARIGWLVHGFSTRRNGGSRCYGGNALNLGFTSHDNQHTVERNRQAFVTHILPKHSKPWPLVTLRQIHSDLIHHITDNPSRARAGDGLITRTPGILLAVLTADCLPIIVVDPEQPAVGVFHAGWRGTVKRVVEKGVGELQRHFGSRPKNLQAVIGPGIRVCCYRVGAELRNAFESQFDYAARLFRETKDTDEVRDKYPLLFLTARAPGHSELPAQIFLDLAEANRRQLLAAGVLAKNIFDLGLCTSCNTGLFFSHRAEAGNTGRMMAAAGIRT
jgi:YfiH family protein